MYFGESGLAEKKRKKQILRATGGCSMLEAHFAPRGKTNLADLARRTHG
jgi:hypothetical protein